MSESEITWREARDAMLFTWGRLARRLEDRERIAPADEVELLSEINATTDLCGRAREKSPDQLRHCPHCRFFEQYGGCRAISLEMSERVAARDLEGLRELVERFIGQLEALDVDLETDRTGSAP